jgi:phosphoribosylaminoimidazole carboxylase PurE protein
VTAVPIILGSRADLEHAQKIAHALDDLGIPWEMRIASAHKTPEHLLDMLGRYEQEPRVYITVAGRSDALSGFVDARVAGPVVACPPPSQAFGGADIYSTLRMPGGVAPALVLEPASAALLAAKILALHDPGLRERLQALRRRQVERTLADDAALRPPREGS